MWKRLGKALITTGAIISIGFNVINAVELLELKLPISVWTAIGLAIAFVGIGALIHGQQKDYDTLKQQLNTQFSEPIKEPIRSLTLQPSAATDKEKTRTTSNEIQSSSWKGLSQAEFAQVTSATTAMLIHHGHIDWNGLIDDQRRGKSLNGLCWLCNKPRFQKGSPLK